MISIPDRSNYAIIPCKSLFYRLPPMQVIYKPGYPNSKNKNTIQSITRMEKSKLQQNHPATCACSFVFHLLHPCCYLDTSLTYSLTYIFTCSLSFPLSINFSSFLCACTSTESSSPSPSLHPGFCPDSLAHQNTHTYTRLALDFCTRL